MSQKNFAYTYDGHHCLRAGWYEVHIRYYRTSGWGHQYMYLNGTAIAATSHSSPPNAQYSGSSYVVNFKRGDVLQFSGGYDSVWGGQYIKRLENK